MPSIEINKVNIITSNNNIQLYPVISILGDCPNGGATGYKLITSQSELDVFFPSIKNKKSINKLLEYGNIVIGRQYKKPENNKDQEINNCAHIRIGTPLMVPQVSYDYESVTDIREFNQLDSFSCYELINGRSTYRYKITIKDGLTENSKPLILMVPLDGATRTVSYVHGDYTSINNKSGEVRVLPNNLTSETDLKNHLVAEIGQILRNSGTGDVINTDDKYFYLTFNSPVPVYYLNHESVKIEPDLSELPRRLYQGDNYICTIKSKLPGYDYNRIKVSISFLGLYIIVVLVDFDGYKETHQGIINDDSSPNYIDYVIERDSNLIHFSWNLLKLLYNKNTNYINQYILGDNNTDILDDYEVYTKIREYLSGIDIRLTGAKQLEYSNEDWEYSALRLKKSCYKPYIITELLERPKILDDDKPNDNILNEEQIRLRKVRESLVSVASKFNSVIGFNYYDIETILYNSTYEFLFYIHGNPIYDKDTYVLPIIPLLNLAQMDMFLGNVPCDFLEPNTNNGDSIVDSNNIIKESYNKIIYSNNYYTGYPNRLDKILSHKGDYRLSAIIALLKVTKTFTTFLEMEMPYVEEAECSNVINRIRGLFSYIDNISISSFIKDPSKRNHLKLVLTITSKKLNIINKKLNINIRI